LKGRVVVVLSGYRLAAREENLRPNFYLQSASAPKI
jgi:hypothetical protein